MGRSQLTTTDKLNRLIQTQLHNFRRALLNRSEQQAFDQLWSVAKNNRLALSQTPDLLPIDAAQMAMLVDLQRQVDALKAEIERAADKG